MDLAFVHIQTNASVSAPYGIELADSLVAKLLELKDRPYIIVVTSNATYPFVSQEAESSPKAEGHFYPIQSCTVVDGKINNDLR